MHEDRWLGQQRTRSLIQQGAAAQGDHYSAFRHKVIDGVGFSLPELGLLLLQEKILDAAACCRFNLAVRVIERPGEALGAQTADARLADPHQPAPPHPPSGPLLS